MLDEQALTPVRSSRRISIKSNSQSHSKKKLNDSKQLEKSNTRGNDEK